MGSIFSVCRRRNDKQIPKDLIKIGEAEISETTLVKTLRTGSWIELVKLLGSTKNVFNLFGTKFERDMLIRVSDRLCSERLLVVPLTDLARCIPSEKGSLDKKYDAVRKICEWLFCDKETYRKVYVAPLRKKLSWRYTKKI